MTISYSYEISTSKYFTFMRILARWRASIWKSTWRELVVWTIGYYIVFCLYRFAMDKEQQHWFEQFVTYCNESLKNKHIPLDFMLGFFVKSIVDRWGKMFRNVGFVDNAAHMIGTLVRGNDPETKTTRRNMIRYLCLTQVLVMRDISMQVRRRFPNLSSVVEARFLLPHEKDILEGYGNNSEEFGKYWMPMSWVFEGCYRLRERGKIASDQLLDSIFVELRDYRHKLQTMCEYDWVPVPLAYTQIVFFAVRVYFLVCVVARQHIVLDPTKDINIYVPFMTMLQLFVYIGWLKVAEALVNPLGEDDDDFECNFIIDRNIAIALAISDEFHGELPEQKPDTFPEAGDEIVPVYSEEAADLPQHPLIGSAYRRKPEKKNHVKMVRRETFQSGLSRREPKSRFSMPTLKEVGESWKSKNASTRNEPSHHNHKKSDGLSDLTNKTIVKIFDPK